MKFIKRIIQLLFTNKRNLKLSRAKIFAQEMMREEEKVPAEAYIEFAMWVNKQEERKNSAEEFLQYMRWLQKQGAKHLSARLDT